MSPEPLTSWEGLPVDGLAERWGLPQLRVLRSVGSTNDVARDLAAQGAPSGTLVLAEEQLAGRGQLGRAWASPAGLGLWLSLVVRRPPPAAQPLLPLLAGLSAARALDEFLGAGRVRIKWPNDLLVDDRKLGGILCEGVWSAGTPAFVVVGLGLNVLHAAGDFPPELRDAATSLRLAGADAPGLRRAAADLLLPRFAADLARAPVLSPAALRELAARDALLGRPVRVGGAAGEPALRGVAEGIAGDGRLRVRDARGRLHPVGAGSVRLDDGAAA